MKENIKKHKSRTISDYLFVHVTAVEIDAVL